MAIGKKLITVNKMKMASYAIIFIMFGFDVRTYLGGFIPINLITSFLIIMIIPISFLFFCKYKRKPLKHKIVFFDSLFCCFFIIYGIRLFINLYIDGIEQYIFNNNITCFVYLIFLCVIPFYIFRKIKWAYIDMKFVLSVLLFLYFTGLILSFKTILSDLASGIEYYQGRADANNFLDTIGYGHLGLSFILACYSYYSQIGMKKWIFYSFTLFGLLSMSLANSRSPFLALLIILIIIFFDHIRLRRIIICCIFAFLLYYNIDNIDLFFKNYFNSPVIERIMMIFEMGMEDASNGRDTLFSAGLRQFEQSPIVGESIVLTRGVFKGAYVHNSIIEVLMGVGLIGFIFYALLNIYAISCAIKLIRRNSQYKFFAFIFIQYSVFLLFSRSLLLLPLYWSSIASIYTCSLIYNKSNK